MEITTQNPATEEFLATYPQMSGRAVDEALSDAVRAQADLACHTMEERCGMLNNLAALLESNTATLAQLITSEMGKPLTQSIAEVTKCAFLCRWTSENAPRILADRIERVDGHEATVHYDPFGVVLAIMPWNFPLWQTLRYAAPAIAAGNGMLLKPAPITTGTGLAITRLIELAGVPQGAMQCLLIDVDRVPLVLSDARVQGVTFTGSTRAGAAVAELAGKHVKKSLLELGGNDAYVVCADADVESAAAVCAEARLINSGQSCVAAKRFLVHRSIADYFTDALSRVLGAAVVGNPMDEGVSVGPLARRDLQQGVLDQVDRAIAAGGRLWPMSIQAELPQQGFFVQPSVIRNVPAGCAVADEEIFGPVALVYAVANDEEAIRIANSSRYGLGAAVFSADADRARTIAKKLDAGMVAINSMVRSHPQLPFGGVKNSGYGRELGEDGLREFTTVKVIR